MSRGMQDGKRMLRRSYHLLPSVGTRCGLIIAANWDMRWQETL